MKEMLQVLSLNPLFRSFKIFTFFSSCSQSLILLIIDLRHRRISDFRFIISVVLVKVINRAI